MMKSNGIDEIEASAYDYDDDDDEDEFLKEYPFGRITATLPFVTETYEFCGGDTSIAWSRAEVGI